MSIADGAQDFAVIQCDAIPSLFFVQMWPGSDGVHQVRERRAACRQEFDVLGSLAENFRDPVTTCQFSD
jgi:hypothetical protein